MGNTSSAKLLLCFSDIPTCTSCEQTTMPKPPLQNLFLTLTIGAVLWATKVRGRSVGDEIADFVDGDGGAYVNVPETECSLASGIGKYLRI